MSNINRSSLDALSTSNFPDNTNQLISAADLRDWIESAVDSFVTQKDKSTFENAFYEAKSSTIIASATVLLSNASGNFVHIQGTTNITSFGTCPAGARFILCFENAANIDASAAIIIPGTSSGNTKTAVAGDCCMIVSEGSGNWRIVGYFPAAAAGAGTVTQITAASPLTGGTITTSGTIGIPQANGSTDGYLDSADWTTFNNKGNGTVTSVSGTGSVNGISLSGTVTGSGSLTLGGTLSGVDLTSQVTGVLPVANGGSGTATPSLVAGTNVTISGSWPNQTINSTGGGGGTPGGANGDFQYKNGGAFDGSNLLRLVSGFVVAHTPKIGDSNTTGHFHMHSANSAPTGISDYLTMFWQKATRVLGFRSETDTYSSYIQLTAPTADRTYTLPDASGNVVLDSTSQTLTNKTLTTPAITTPAITGVTTIGNGTSAGEIRLLEGSGSGSNYVAIKSPGTLANDYNFVLPVGVPTSNNQALIGDTSGNLSWSSNPGTTIAKFLSNTTANSITGTTAETIVATITIPANTYSAGDIIGAFFRVRRLVPQPSANDTLRFYISTTTSFSGAVALGLYAIGNQNTHVLCAERNIVIQTSSTQFFANTTSVASDIGQLYSPYGSSAIDWTITQYLIMTVTPYNIAQTINHLGMSISPR